MAEPIRQPEIRIRIDGEGDGAWIMARVGGSPFVEGYDHSLMVVRERVHAGGTFPQRLGGFALCNYLGGSIAGHMAGEGPGWMSRTLLRATFGYVFDQLGCVKFLAMARGRALDVVAMDMRAGFRLEAVVRDAYGAGEDMLILSMTRERCPWLS